MDKPLRQHIAELEKRVQQLSQEIMKNQRTRTERNSMESELRVAQQALDYYHKRLSWSNGYRNGREHPSRMSAENV